MAFPRSIFFIVLLFLLFISSTSTTINPSLLSSLHFTRSLTGHQLFKDLNLHPNLEANIYQGYNSSDYEIYVSEYGIVEKRLSFRVLGNSGATVSDLTQHAGYFRLQHTIDARYISVLIVFGLGIFYVT